MNVTLCFFSQSYVDYNLNRKYAYSGKAVAKQDTSIDIFNNV